MFYDYLSLERRYSPHTVLGYRCDVDQLHAYLLTLKIDDVATTRVADLRRYLLHLTEEKLEARSINRKLSAIRSYFTFLQSQGLATVNPAKAIKLLKAPKRLPIILPEAGALAKTAGITDESKTPYAQARDQMIFQLFEATGMRLAELIALKLENFTVGFSQMLVLGKGKKNRQIPVLIGLRSERGAYAMLRKAVFPALADTHFFVTGKGAPLYPMLVQRIVKAKLAGSAASKKSPHTLRHTFATELLNNGGDLNQIKELLGHANLQATQIYTHMTSAKLKKSYENAFPKKIAAK